MFDKNNPPDQDAIEVVIDMFSDENTDVYMGAADRKETHRVLQHLYLDYFEMKELWLEQCREVDRLSEAANDPKEVIEQKAREVK